MGQSLGRSPPRRPRRRRGWPPGRSRSPPPCRGPGPPASRRRGRPRPVTPRASGALPTDPRPAPAAARRRPAGRGRRAVGPRRAPQRPRRHLDDARLPGGERARRRAPASRGARRRSRGRGGAPGPRRDRRQARRARARRRGLPAAAAPRSSRAPFSPARTAPPRPPGARRRGRQPLRGATRRGSRAWREPVSVRAARRAASAAARGTGSSASRRARVLGIARPVVVVLPLDRGWVRALDGLAFLLALLADGHFRCVYALRGARSSSAARRAPRGSAEQLLHEVVRGSRSPVARSARPLSDASVARIGSGARPRSRSIRTRSAESAGPAGAARTRARRACSARGELVHDGVLARARPLRRDGRRGERRMQVAEQLRPLQRLLQPLARFLLVHGQRRGVRGRGARRTPCAGRCGGCGARRAGSRASVLRGDRRRNLFPSTFSSRRRFVHIMGSTAREHP